MTFRGDNTLNADVSLSNVAIVPNASLSGSGKLTATNLNWSGGTILGTGNQAYDVTNLTLSGTAVLDGRTLNLLERGMSSISQSSIHLSNNAVLNNAGTLNLTSGASLSNYYGSENGGGVINNSGIINAIGFRSIMFIGGAYLRTVEAAPIVIGSSDSYGKVDFNNTSTGLIHVQGGTLQLNSPLTINNRGQIQIDTGATLATNADLNNAQGAKISGSGTVSLNEHALINNGVVAPGFGKSTGTLTINGNYTQGNTGEFIVKIAAGEGVQHDQLNVNGATKLDGQLTVNSLYGYVPALGEAFTVIGGATASQTLGKFVRVSLPDYISAGYGAYEGAPLRLNYVAGSGTNFFNNAGGDFDWANAANWSGNHTPVSVSDVLIDTGFTVQHASGSDKIRSLIVNANSGLNISGGSLAVIGLSTVGGTLTVGAAGSATLSGGLKGSGTLAIDGGNVRHGAASTIANLAMTGGTFAGTTDFTVLNSLQQTGGAMQFAGAKVDLHQSTGDLLINNLTADTTNLVAANGAIAQTGDGLTLDALTTQSTAGTRLNNAANQITSLSAINTGSGDIVVASTGALVLVSVSNAAGAVSLAAGGAITQTGSISGKTLTTSSIGGTTLNGANRISSFSALNAGSGDISLFNTTRPDAMTLLAVKNAAGSIAIDNTGAIITSGRLDAAGGTLKLTAHSPIMVNSGLTARDGITLTALPSTLGIDTIAINGTLASTTGNIVASSGTNTTISSNSTLQVASGSVIALTALNGAVDVRTGATFVGASPTISQSVVAVVVPQPPVVSQPPVVPPPAAPVEAAALLQPLQSVAVDTIDSLQKTIAPFGNSSAGSTLLASAAANSDTESNDSSSGSGLKKTDGAKSSSDGAKSKSDKSAKSLPVCN